MVPHRITMVGCLADRGIRVCAEQQCVGPADAGEPQRREGLADDVRVLPGVGRHGKPGIRRSLPDADDACRRVALEDRAVLGESHDARGILDRLPVRVLGATLDVIDGLPADGERHPELDDRLRGPRPREHARRRRLDVTPMTGSYCGRRARLRARDLRYPAAGQVQREGAPGFFLNAGPGRGGDWRELAVQVVHSWALLCRLPMRSEPSRVRADAPGGSGMSPRNSADGTKNRLPVTAVGKTRIPG